MSRRALVVGIDYPGTYYELAGCVNDARQWADWLTRRGFRVELLTNADATHRTITETLTRLVRLSRSGLDVLAMAYSGHGSRARDTNGDEADGWDETLCPVDMDTAGLLLDDTLYGILRELPARVGFTMIADSCHSGTVTRFAEVAPAMAARTPEGRRGRFLYPTRAILEATAAARGAEPRALVEAPRWATLSACRPDEVAYESEGDDGAVGGHFTQAAMRVLATAGARLAHAGFLRRVREAMGAGAAQTPTFDGAPGTEQRTIVTVPR